MKNLKLTAVFFNLILALFAGAFGGILLDVNPLIIAVLVLMSGFIRMPQGAVFMALQTEIWIQDIKDVLYKGSEFINFSTDHSQWIANKTVHVPQAGASPAITKNRSSVPATIVTRTDVDLEYSMDEFTTEPVLIADLDELQTSYSKRISVIGSHTGTLMERIGDETINIWAPSNSAARTVRTTGSTATDNLAPSATGSRKVVLKADIKNLAKILDEDNMPQSGRYLLMSVDMYYELFEIDALIRLDFMGNVALPEGVIRKLFGFNIMVRPTTVIYDNATPPVKKSVGAAGAAADNQSCIAWQSNEVSRALGAIKVFADEDKPEYYGSIWSALIMHGASPLRTSGVGTATLVQAA